MSDVRVGKNMQVLYVSVLRLGIKPPGRPIALDIFRDKGTLRDGKR